jgi:hypothetical protein
MIHKPRVVVLGILGRTPLAGVAWQVLHYLEGFRRLGYDVSYVEDTGDWPYNPEQNAVIADCAYNVRFLARLMARVGLGERWAYRSVTDGGKTFGLPQEQVAALLAGADALLNLTGGTVLREEHLAVPVRIYLETDPVLPQIELAGGAPFTTGLLAAHTHHFTYGENLGAADCGVPDPPQFDYRPTRQPVVLDWWRPGARLPFAGGEGPTLTPAAGCFTTVGSWRQSGKDVEWGGQTYTWSKHHEFLKFLDLPRRAGRVFELALACDDAETLRLLKDHGWRVADALALSKEPVPYREYVLGSRGEFTVAKDQNVRLRSGWFSDRSACYLAAGKPVVTQDTGFGNVLPTGRGLFAFRTADDVLAALDAVAADYDGHCRAAREIAAEYFAVEKVVGALCRQAGL